MYDMTFPKTTVSVDGVVTMLNNYAQGIGDTQRSKDTTFTKSISLRFTLGGSQGFWAYPNYMMQYYWLVVDYDCGGTFPGLSDIFEWPTDCDDQPATWRIRRSANNRFVVKRHWTSHLSSGGINYGDENQNRARLIPPNPKKPIKKFFSNLNITTKWKDTGGGKYDDVKEGALLFIAVNDAKAKTTMFASLIGTSRAYFTVPRN